MNEMKQQALAYLDEHRAELVDLARVIWENPEIGLHEFFAVDAVCKVLEKNGFVVQKGVGALPTACIGSWGSGAPVIGVLGEYDALPGISQKVSAVKEAIIEGAPGHGCGHNLFAGGSLGAAMAMKAVMQAHNLPGTVRFYGCPAEETLVGKVVMAREGVFDDLDAAIVWHPGSVNSPGGMTSSLALNSFKVNFHGISTHAAASPHMGRSALKGVQLMDIGVSYLREHLEPDARVHCVITRGGEAPNVVPAYAQVWYYIRAPFRHQVEAIYARVMDIAKGAALMSGTTYDVEFLNGCYETLPNMPLSDAMMAEMQALGGPKFTAEDYAFARELTATVPPETQEAAYRGLIAGSGKGITRADIGEYLSEAIIPPIETYTPMAGSTDVGDVSQITPTASLSTACQPITAPPHGWQLVAASNSNIGFTGMMYAAQVLALTGIELLTNPDLRKAAREYYETASAGRVYQSPLAEGSFRK